MMPLMLDTLDDVPWHQLTHAYGQAVDVPPLLRALTSADAPTRDQARYELYGNVFHQGTRFEASAYAVPFLVELALEPSVPERGEIVGLLTHLAVGHQYEHMVEPFPVDTLRAAVGPFDPAWRAEVSARYVYWVADIRHRQPPDRVERMIAKGVDELRAYEAVQEAVPKLLTLLDDADDEVAASAAHALAWFPERAALTVPALVAVAADEARQTRVRTTALLAAGMAGRDPGQLADLLSRLARADDEDLRWAAAATWALTAGAGAPDDAKAVLRARAEAGEDEDDWLPWLWDRNGWSLRLLDAVDAQASAEARRQLVAAALEAIPDGDAVWHNRLVHPFDLAYPDGYPDEPAPYGRLSPAQRCLVEFLVAHPEAFTSRHQGAGHLLRRHQLPDEHPALAAFSAATSADGAVPPPGRGHGGR